MLTYILFIIISYFFTFQINHDLLSQKIPIAQFQNLKDKNIREIQLLGLKINDPNMVYSNLSTQKGDVFDPQKIENDFNRLQALNLFKTITLDYKTPDQDDCVLIFKFVEYPIIQRIQIHGNNEIETKEIQKIMELKELYIYKDFLLRNDKINIIELYKRKQFEYTQVHLEVHEKEPYKVNVNVHIDEGIPLHIQKIRIIGTRFLIPDQIAKHMETKASSFFLGKQVLDKAKLAKDRLKILAFMQSQGHYHGKIRSLKIIKEKIKNTLGLSIIIEIDEGPRFYFGQIQFQGNKLSDEDIQKLKALIPPQLKEAQLFNMNLVKIYMNYIQNLFHNQSYLQVAIRPEFIVKEMSLRINIIFHITKGEKIYLERIFIKGNSITQFHVIDQELEIFEGELFNAKKVKNSLQNLQKLGFFKNVNILFENKKYDQLTNLIFKIEEQPFGTINFGASYNSQNKFGIHAQFNKKNLLGTGWNLQASGQYDENTIYVNAASSVKWLVPYIPLSLDLRLSYAQRKILISNLIRKDIVKENLDYAYHYRHINFNFLFGYPIIRNLYILSGYSFAFTQSYDMENFIIQDLDNSKRSSYLKEDLETFVEGKKSFLAKISQIFIFKYDDLRTPSSSTKEGFLLSTKWIYTGGIPYYGDSHWIKTENNIQIYFIPIWKLVLVARMRYASLFQQFTKQFKIREFDLLQFNPYTELRGWNQSNNQYLSSKGSLLSLSTEVHIPLFEPFVGAIGFLDAGDTNPTTPSFPTQIYHFSFGFGLKVLIPILPITIYFPIRADYNISKKDEFHVHEGIDILVSLTYQF